MGACSAEGEQTKLAVLFTYTGEPIAQKKTYRMLSEYEYALGTALEFDLAPHQVSQFHSILEHLTLEGAKNYDFGKVVSEVKLQAQELSKRETTWTAEVKDQAILLVGELVAAAKTLSLIHI